MHSSGSADVDVFPLLELYARIASLAGRTDVVGTDGGVRSRYALLASDPLAEYRRPSELVDEVDRAQMDASTTDKRDHYRDLLQDAMYTALRNMRKQQQAATKRTSSFSARKSGSLNAGGSSARLMGDEQDE